MSDTYVTMLDNMNAFYIREKQEISNTSYLTANTCKFLIFKNIFTFQTTAGLKGNLGLLSMKALPNNKLCPAILLISTATGTLTASPGTEFSNGLHTMD